MILVENYVWFCLTQIYTEKMKYGKDDINFLHELLVSSWINIHYFFLRVKYLVGKLVMSDVVRFKKMFHFADDTI